MGIEPWVELDVTGWLVIASNPIGTRPKDWVEAPDGSRWLRKAPRRKVPGRPAPRDAELAIEAIALRLARAAGLPAPESAVAQWRESDGAEGRGIVVKSFLQEHEELSLGSQLLAGAEGYDPERHELHTLDRVRTALTRLETTTTRGALTVPFARLLAFDSWVGNGDRHQENWGIIRAPGTAPRLAPVFDPAACLGSQVGQNDRKLRTPTEVPDMYVQNCPSGFGDGVDLLKQPAVIKEARAWPEWENSIGSWIASFVAAEAQVDALLQQVPFSWLSAERQQFVRTLLRVRLEWLNSVA